MAERTVMTRLKADISDFQRGMLAAGASAKTFSKELDTGNDRTTAFTQSILAIGPAVVPLSAAVVPAIAGLSNQLGIAAVGAGTMALAFSGVGDALKAVNDYAVEPTDANLKKMNQTLNELGPAGRDFVGTLQSLRPQLQRLQDVAQAGLFPGATEGIQKVMTLLPEAERIVGTVATTIGQLIAEAGDNLADPRWQDFFTFLENDARPTLLDMGRTLGNFAEGFANLWMAFDPLSKDFSNSFLQLSRDFATWTDGLGQTQGFQDFIAYVERVGPKVFDTLAALGDAFLQIVEAAAPVGEATLPVITALAKAVGALADSDLGPFIIGLVSVTSALARIKALGVSANSSAIGGLFGNAFGGSIKAAKDIPAATRAYLDYGAALDTAGPAVGKFATTSERLGSALKGGGKIAGSVGLLAFAVSDLDDKMGLTNTTMFAMAGSVVPGWGTAIGATIGLAVDLSHQTDNAAESVKNLQQAFKGATTLSDQQAIIDQGHQIADAFGSIDGGLLGGKAQEESQKVLDGLKPLEAAHRANVRAAEDQQFAEAGLADSMSNTSDETRKQTLALIDNIDAKNKDADAAENAFSAETNYRQALKDAREQADKTNAGIDGSSDAALKNRESLDQLATSWNRVADAGNASSKDARKARQNFIDVAESMGVSKKQAQELADQLLHLPSPKVKVNADTKAAKKAIDDFLAAFNAIVPFKTVTLTYKQNGQPARPVKDSEKADGGAIVGPGTGTSDDIPAWLSNGEHVLTADEVAKAGGQGAIYRMRAGIRSGALKFADGGAVTALDINKQRQTVRDLERELDATETLGKGKAKHKRLVARGLDRTVLRQELAEARKDLADLRNGTADKEEAAADAAKDYADAVASSKADFGRNFTIGSLTSADAVDRSLTKLLADSITFTGLLSDLKSKGASPWLLGQLVAAGPTPTAIRIARQYDTDSGKLATINSLSSQFDQAANVYAGLINSPSFMSAGASNQIALASKAPMVAHLLGAEVQVADNGLLKFVKGQIVMSQQSQQIEARNWVGV